MFPPAAMRWRSIAWVTAATMPIPPISMGKPAQLYAAQVEQIKKQNDGSPLREIVTIGGDGNYSSEVNLRENDVYFQPG